MTSAFGPQFKRHRRLIILPTITEAIAEGARRLAEARVDEARRTAGALLGNLLGVDRTYLIARSDDEIDNAGYQSYLALIERRSAGEPLQYITSHQEFYGLDFIVSPAVLIPRPETEHLVDQVIRLSRKRIKAGQGDEPLIADVGTGSGCIAVALAVNIPGSRVFATDISPYAILVARKNALNHVVGDRVEFVTGDVLAPLKGRGLEERFDFIASNPPYVPEADIDHLQREIRGHEPRVALSGGELGLDFYSRLLDEAFAFLKPGCYLVCEIGFSQLDAIRALIRPPRWELTETTFDLQGIPRALTIQRK